MSENTPLNGNIPKYNDEEQLIGEEYNYQNSWSSRTKIIIYTIIGIFTLTVLLFFTIFLPNYYIPKGIPLKPIIHISELNVSVLPHQDKSHINRLIMIGDIHGHYNEFRKLLKKASYNPKKDELLVLGDFVTKGPDNFKMLDYLIDNKVSCIMGNHEFYLLQNYATFHMLDQPTFLNNNISSFRIKESFNNDPEFIFAKKLQPKHVEYINNCSIIKELGPVPLTNEKNAPGIAVHAGVRPDLTLEEQNPVDNLEMRDLVGPYYNETTSDSDTPNSKSWSKIYNSKNGAYPANNIVLYGHDARRGLKLKKYTKGLDSGCDKGGKLSAFIISSTKNNKGRINLTQEVIQINC
ncbi:uncharacterized protein KGF55_005161 [Candida pseudojiufengensis]|uniref:uncharacterized protein n=1 Tax=Candida pseudojiufengensis TaxID=497109 RepID=UPI0022246F3E|nr:uncharacterized protein KGF55_005161 [Candida pseudojiufengensis]KAI5959929.1 hypothetical protein KGF55_005161 [Candida pseudojiufengensis]